MGKDRRGSNGRRAACATWRSQPRRVWWSHWSAPRRSHPWRSSRWYGPPPPSWLCSPRSWPGAARSIARPPKESGGCASGAAPWGAGCTPWLACERRIVVVAQRLQPHGDRLLQRRGRPDGQEIVHLADGIARGRRGDDRSHAPPRHAERLRRAADGDGALAHPVERRDRDVLAFVIDVLVNLVGHGVGVGPS